MKNFPLFSHAVLLLFLSIHCAKEFDPKMKEFFESADTNSDGFLTKEEIVNEVVESTAKNLGKEITNKTR